MDNTAKPPALEIPDGTDELHASELAAEFRQRYADWAPDGRITRPPPRAVQVTAQMMADQQATQRQKAIREYLDAPEPPGVQDAWEADLLKRADAEKARKEGLVGAFDRWEADVQSRRAPYRVDNLEAHGKALVDQVRMDMASKTQYLADLEGLISSEPGKSMPDLSEKEGKLLGASGLTVQQLKNAHAALRDMRERNYLADMQAKQAGLGKHGVLEGTFETRKVELNESWLKRTRCDRWRVGESDFGWSVFVQGRDGPFMSFPTKHLAMMVYEFLSGHTEEAEMLREKINDDLPKAP